MSEPRYRQAARALILDPGDRALLVRFEFPHRSFWATPGGGVNEGESHEQAVLRELHEEVGLTGVELGPFIWTGRRLYRQLAEDVGFDGQVDRFFLVRVESFEPVPLLSWDELRAEYVTALRWWTLDELAASEEEFEPARLPELVAAILADGPPPQTLDVG